MVKKRGINIGSGFKVGADGKVSRDLAASEAKLDVSTRLQRRYSKRVWVEKPGSAAPVTRDGRKA